MKSAIVDHKLKSQIFYLYDYVIIVPAMVIAL